MKLKHLPGVLSFMRCVVMNDWLFFNLQPNGTTTPLHVMRHGIRGTQNINKFHDDAGGTAKSTKRQEVSNIQRTDSAKLEPGTIGLQVEGNLRFIPLDRALFACAPGKKDTTEDLKALKAQLVTFLESEQARNGIREVAQRFARNIANGRALWRNRQIATEIVTTVTYQGRTIGTFKSLEVPLNHFNNITQEEALLADIIVQQLTTSGTDSIAISHRVTFGMNGPLEVYPSQNNLNEKLTGFARSLYCVGHAPEDQAEHSVELLGQAALRDQKVWNALRTIDTWYPDYKTRQLPIPIEPMGASLDAQEFFRSDKTSSSFRMMLRLNDLTQDEASFMVGCLIRAGVYSGGDK